MATHKSSEKRARQDIKRNAINRSRRSQVHTLIKSFEAIVAAGDTEQALAALRKVEASLAKNAGKGLMPKKTAARKTSRLAQRVRKLSTGEAPVAVVAAKPKAKAKATVKAKAAK